MDKRTELSQLLDYYGGLLTKRQQKLLALHLDEDYSLFEIAEREGISRQGVHDAIKRAQQQLINIESKLGFQTTGRCIEAQLDLIIQYVNELCAPQQQKEQLARAVEKLKQICEDGYGI